MSLLSFRLPCIRSACGSLVMVLAIVLGLCGLLRGQEDASGDNEESQVQHAARKIAESIKLTVAVNDQSHELELVKQPVLRFGDIPRANDKGSVWIWQRAGRPQAVMELYHSSSTRSWVQVVHSLSADALEGEFGAQASRWRPPRAGIEWKPFPDAPVPAERPAIRARQIKELAQKFTAHEFWDPNNSRFELRLLVQPAHKHSAPDSGLLDGALFLLCHETNPETALLIEAVQEDGVAKFRYALARLGHAELHVEFAGQEVWRQDRLSNTSPRDAYWLSLRAAEP